MSLTNNENQERLLAFLSVGVYSALDIQQRFGCSQATVSRMLAQLGPKVLAFGKARARRYTRLRDVRGLGGTFPVYKIDTDGNAHLLGNLYAVGHDQYLWQPHDAPEQLYRSLPWFLSDLYPDGFVGRAFVRQLHQEFGLPARIVDWNDDHVLTALARRGEDPMGNLVIGYETIERYLQLVREPLPPIPAGEIDEAYTRLAQAAMDGQHPGSSAGGEQPKFTAVIERDGVIQNVLVKFSPLVTSEEGRRWADLLVCEHHALGIIQEEACIPASRSRIVESGGRVFLEVVRFDRVGLIGRLPIVSLRAIDNEFYGAQDSWINAAGRLVADKRFSVEDARAMRWLSVFGSLIANTDQHFGNISLIMVDGSKRYNLAPAYDILPMYYRPTVDGVIPSQVFTPPAAVPNAPNEWESALHCATLFWERAAADTRISESFRKICEENLTAIRRLTSGPRLVT
jgi:hypothetical protein